MDRLGLGPVHFGAYLRTIATPGHQRRIKLDVLDLSDNSHRSSLTEAVVEGQIVYDVTAETTRMADIRFVDERNRLGFEPDDPSDAPIHRSRLIRVTDSRLVEEYDLGWVHCHAFTGPIWDFQRTGVEVSLTAHGMEAQALGAVGEPFHFHRKRKITDAIRVLLAAVGDVNAVVPDLPRTLPKDLVVHPDDAVWPHVKHLCAALDRRCYYNGSGRFQMPRMGNRPVYRFDGTLTEPVTVKRSVDGFVNQVVVLGPKPHGPKKRVRGEATLKGVLSPSALSRHGVPFRARMTEERQHVKNKKQADAIAARLLREHATLRTDLSFSALPMSFFEEEDMVAVTDDAFGTERLRMRQWNLPLEAGDLGGSEGSAMTVGTIRRTTKARIRR